MNSPCQKEQLTADTVYANAPLPRDAQGPASDELQIAKMLEISQNEARILEARNVSLALKLEEAEVERMVSHL